MTPRLTIVLPLKGRDEFTFRFLWHANKTKLPYRFLIADGLVNEIVARQLENSREIFPDLDIEYVRYPNDDSYSRFFAKMSNALQRVRTPYAMMAENNTFLGPHAIEGALDYLDLHPDYVCARGRIAAFSVFSGFGNPRGALCGDLNDIYLQYESDNVSEPTAAERLRRGLDLGRYNAICRSGALAAIWRDAGEIDFSDLMLHESFHVLRAVTLGKAHVDQTSISYFRQIGTSSNYDPFRDDSSRDWVRRLLRGRFTLDTQAMVDRLSTAAAADCANAKKAAEDVRAMIEQYIREFLFVNFGAVTQLKRMARDKFPNLVKFMQSRPSLFMERKRSALFSRLAEEGASAENIERERAQFADIENTLAQVAVDAGFSGRLSPTTRPIGAEMAERSL